MVFTHLQGGLGNQLFQYAMGLATSVRNKTRLKLDVTAYQEGRLTPLRRALTGLPQHECRHRRAYALDKWNIEARFASFLEVRALKLYDRVVCAARPDLPHFSRAVVREQQHGFDPQFLNVPRNCLLVGFWQSERFFKDVEPRLRRELKPRSPLTPHAEAMARDIKSTEHSIFLHVRRGDYVSNENFEVCSLAYYQKAISYVRQRVGLPKFFLFSDDPEWARKNLAVDDNFTLVTRLDMQNDSHSGYEHEDLWLMSGCRHGILSNSSFSWWGAWLNGAEHRIVVAPALWLPKPACDSRVFIPERWIRIDN